MHEEVFYTYIKDVVAAMCKSIYESARQVEVCMKATCLLASPMTIHVMYHHVYTLKVWCMPYMPHTWDVTPCISYMAMYCFDIFADGVA